MIFVKICGITNARDAELAASAGADCLGFVFYPPSPRYITPHQAREIVAQTRRRYPRVRFAGVFVDEPTDKVCKIAAHSGLDLVQLHGSEPPTAVEQLIDRGLGVIKAFRVRDGDSLVRARVYRPTLCLLDTYVPDNPGGTGQTFDWVLAAEVPLPAPVILAGGLSAENVSHAICIGQPWGVDVSSGVEHTPGRKDPDKLKRFVGAAKLVPEKDDVRHDSNH